MPEISLVGNLGPNVGDEADCKEISGRLMLTSYAEKGSNLTNFISFHIRVNLNGFSPTSVEQEQ